MVYLLFLLVELVLPEALLERLEVPLLEELRELEALLEDLLLRALEEALWLLCLEEAELLVLFLELRFSILIFSFRAGAFWPPTPLVYPHGGSNIHRKGYRPCLWIFSHPGNRRF